jgi:hypothetical protein
MIRRWGRTKRYAVTWSVGCKEREDMRVEE